MLSLEEENKVKKDLLSMFGNITELRRELAHLETEGPENFATMSDTLDAIIEHTEEAGNAILENMEAIESTVGQLRKVDNAEVTAACDQIGDSTNKVYEACAFQDLTGQRITRVVKSLKFIEDHVTALVRMWGKEELARIAEEMKVQPATPEGDAALLHGPQRASAAISQDDIDKLFG